MKKIKINTERIENEEKFKKGLSIIKKIISKGKTAFFVGGCVRDFLTGIIPKDYDIATDAFPDEIENIFSNTKPVGKQFGVILVIIDKIPFEVATFRTDKDYKDGRRPKKVIFTTPEEDALRRDFTINGMFLDPIKKEIIDYVNGLEDINKKIIRAIGDPYKRFEEDKLRMLRAIRFASVLDFKIEDKTWKAIIEKHSEISVVSSERIRDELIKLLTSKNAYNGLKLLYESKLLKTILPEVEKLSVVKQPPQFHPTENALEHTMLLFKFLENPSPTLAMAALLHDIGKAETMTITDRIRFHNHHNVGAKIAENILKRLKFPNNEIELITRYIRNHMKFIDVKKMKQSTLKKFLAQDNFEEELEMHKADCLASHKNLENYEYCKNILNTLKKDQLKPDPILRGKDLIEMGYKPGKIFSTILEYAYNKQLEEPKITKNKLKSLVRKKFPIKEAE